MSGYTRKAVQQFADLCAKFALQGHSLILLRRRAGLDSYGSLRAGKGRYFPTLDAARWYLVGLEDAACSVHPEEKTS